LTLQLKQSEVKPDIMKKCVILRYYPDKCPYTDNTKCELCWWLK